MRTQPESQTLETLSLAIMLLGVIVIGMILFLFVRLQRGLLGFVLAAFAVILLVYWLKEVRGAVRKELSEEVPPSKAKWVYDLIEKGEGFILVTEVPGPESQIEVKLVGRILEIVGGCSFQKQVKIPKEVEISETTYRNGILQVKLKKKGLSDGKDLVPD